MAKDHGPSRIEGYSNMDKSELISALRTIRGPRWE